MVTLKGACLPWGELLSTSKSFLGQLSTRAAGSVGNHERWELHRWARRGRVGSFTVVVVVHVQVVMHGTLP